MDGFKLVRHLDSDYDGDTKNGVFTQGYLMSLGSAAISWRSRMQTVPTYFTTEVEYVAAADATKEIVWLRKLLEDLQEKELNATPLLNDNTSAIKFGQES